MLRSKTRWKLRSCDRQRAEQLASELGIHPVTAQLLLVRGISEADEARRFLYPDVKHYYDPMRMKGMPQAVQRLREAIDAGEKIRVYGDYDADGVTSTALMIRLLRKLGANFDYYIPDRIREGYGLNVAALERAKAEGVRLILTVDNGISAKDQIAYASGLGLDVIVTDHHEPPEQLPEEAVAIVNPKQPGCPYPFSMLSGAGVALKLAQAIIGAEANEWADIAAIGTVADVMPLVDENRVIVKSGLERINSVPLPGIRALIKVAGIGDQEVSAGHIGFALGPRINASGRLDSADTAVRLLITNDEAEAEQLALELDRLNKERQTLVEELYEQAVRFLETEGHAHDEVIVAAGENWNAGVIGIVASRLLDSHSRPSIVFSVDPETGLAKGSARSIPALNMHHALTRCADLLEHFGGHAAAAGMTIQASRIPELRQRMCKIAKQTLSEDDYIPISEADVECRLDEVRLDWIEQLNALAPFGEGNPPPRFIFSAAGIEEMRTMGKEDRHLKLLARSSDTPEAALVEVVGFGKGDWVHRISMTSHIDILGEIGINEWNGRRKPQILIHDARITSPQVFDWRNQAIIPKLREMIDAIDDVDAASAVLIYEPWQAQEWLDEWGETGSRIGIWLAQRERSPVPFNDVARKNGWERVVQLFLYHLPSELMLLETALRYASRLERIYALFFGRRQDKPLFSGR